jgi:hypothetical protein
MPGPSYYLHNIHANNRIINKVFLCLNKFHARFLVVIGPHGPTLQLACDMVDRVASRVATKLRRCACRVAVAPLRSRLSI